MTSHRTSAALATAFVLALTGCSSSDADGPQVSPTTSVPDDSLFVCSSVTPVDEALDELVSCVAVDSGIVAYLNLGRADGELLRASLRSSASDGTGAQADAFHALISETLEMIGVDDAPSLSQLLPDKKPVASGDVVKVTSGGLDYKTLILPPDEAGEPIQRIELDVTPAGADRKQDLTGSVPGVEIDLSEAAAALDPALGCELSSPKTLRCEIGELGASERLRLTISAVATGEFTQLVVDVRGAAHVSTAEQILGDLAEHGNDRFAELISAAIEALHGDDRKAMRIAGIPAMVEPVNESGAGLLIGTW
ncbi:hypothetical protein [Blastococcus sp. Marseille-P5729]|uniref:hypothetical protein n=1 Tax=Blastococcus sp. Marseille-P5729 TaxID=2086582 RepID=UPI00131E023C|nr:hypothetical protein [Blastococcus sp. Marseille-P5729]